MPGVRQTSSGVVQTTAGVVDTIGIPDSGGTNQWNHDEGSGTTLTDSIGSLDGSISGATWTAGAGTNNTFLLYDGTDDVTTLGTDSQSALNHWITGGQGTIVVWHRLDATGSILPVFGTRESGQDNHFLILNRSDANDDYRFFVTIGGSVEIDISGGSPSQGDWVALAATSDGSTAEFFVAEPPGYTLTSLGTDSNITTGTGDLSDPVKFGEEAGGRGNFEGGIDLSYVDDTGQSQATIQDFIDNSKEFYV